MKLPQSIQTKQTVRLFTGKYKYKIVLVSKAAGWFRGAKLDNVKQNIANVDLIWSKKLNADDRTYALDLATAMSTMSDYVIRVESPYINFYTNNEKDIETIAKINALGVKYISLPAAGSESSLDDNKIIVKNLDFDYRVTMGRTRQNHFSFVEWCKDKDKIKLTKRAASQLSKDASWGGYYFYVKDDKTMTMVKMFVGGAIQAIERCVKQ